MRWILRKHFDSEHRLGLQFSQFGPASELIVLSLPVQVLNVLPVTTSTNRGKEMDPRLTTGSKKKKPQEVKYFHVFKKKKKKTIPKKRCYTNHLIILSFTFNNRFILVSVGVDQDFYSVITECQGRYIRLFTLSFMPQAT